MKSQGVWIIEVVPKKQEEMSESQAGNQEHLNAHAKQLFVSCESTKVIVCYALTCHIWRVTIHMSYVDVMQAVR